MHRTAIVAVWTLVVPLSTTVEAGICPTSSPTCLSDRAPLQFGLSVRFNGVPVTWLATTSDSFAEHHLAARMLDKVQFMHAVMGRIGELTEANNLVV